LRPITASAIGLLTACSPIGPERRDDGAELGSPGAHLLVSTDALHFGAVSVLEDGVSVLPLDLENVGTDQVVVDELLGMLGTQPDEVAAFSIQGDTAIDLAPGEVETLHVAFEPDTDRVFHAELFLDATTRLARLEGVGTAPVARVSAQWSAVQTPIECSEDLLIGVENVGSEPLVVSDAWIGTSEDFAVVVPEAPIGPGELGFVEATFTPQVAGFDAEDRSDVLTVETNDPLTPFVTVDVNATAVDGGEVVESVPFDVSGSADLLVIADGGLDSYRSELREFFGDLVQDLGEAHGSVHIAGLGATSPCPITTPSFVSSTSDPGDQVDLLDEALPWSEDASGAALLELAVDALDRTIEGSCLEGFRQDGAPLHVILFPRGADSSSTALPDQLYFLEDAAGDGPVYVSVVGGTGDTACVEHPAATGYTDAAASTGGASIDLCVTGWESSYDLLVDVTGGNQDRDVSWTLAEDPYAETLQLSVDGHILDSETWSYESETNTVVIHEAANLTTGQTVDIRYLRRTDC